MQLGQLKDCGFNATFSGISAWKQQMSAFQDFSNFSLAARSFNSLSTTPDHEHRQPWNLNAIHQISSQILKFSINTIRK